MKRIAALALLTIAYLSTSAGANAQAYGLKAKIPFDFTVGNSSLPAGEYRISSPLRAAIQLRSADNASVATVLSSHKSHDEGSGNVLVFHKYGNRYFLNRILCSSNSALNLEMPLGKAEKEEVAKLRTGQEILIAAK